MTNTRNSHEHTHFWLDSQLDTLELLQARYTSFAFTPHAHETYAVGVTEIGAQTYRSGRTRRLLMPAGSAAVVHPGEIHASQSANHEGWRYRMFYPKAALLQRVAGELAGHSRDLPAFPSNVIHDPALTRHILGFHMAAEDPKTPLLLRQSLLLEVLGLLITRHAESRTTPFRAGAEPGCVRLIRQYLLEHYAETVTLERLAGLVNLSPFHFLRVFRKTTGMTPHAYLTHLRIEQAKHLLRQRLPLADVAAGTGFVDQSHFSRYFKRIVGIPPGQYC